MGGGGKGAKAPKAPDYSALAQQQGQINQQTAQQLTQANRPNQVDAFGNSITWSQTPVAGYDTAMNRVNAYKQEMQQNPWWDQKWANQILSGYQAEADKLKADGTWTQQQNLNPETKAIWDKYQSDAGQAGSRYGDILNSYLSNYSQGPGNKDFSSGSSDIRAYLDPEFNGKDVSDALYGSVMDRGRVEQGRETDSLNNKLRLQGLVPGSEAYNRAMQNLTTSHNDANLLAAQNATLAGGAEGRAKYASYLSGEGQQFGQDLAQYGANTNNYLQNRNQPLQELSGMAGIAGGQPYQPNYPGFGGATGYNPTDLIGAANAQYGASANKSNASNAKKGGLLGAGASLGGSFLGSK